MILKVLFVLTLILFIIFVIKHFLGMQKVQHFLKNSNDEFFKERESPLIKLTTHESLQNSTAYEYIWSQRYIEHKDKDFVSLCSKTFKNGLYSIGLFIILIVCL